MSGHVDEVDQETIQQMRGWVKECEWEQSLDDPDFVDGLTDAEVLAGVDNHYGGGAAQFVADGQP